MKEGGREGGRGRNTSYHSLPVLYALTHVRLLHPLPPSTPLYVPVRLPPLPRKRRYRPYRRDRLLSHAPCLGIQLLAQCRQFPDRAEEECSGDTQEGDDGAHNKG